MSVVDEATFAPFMPRFRPFFATADSRKMPLNQAFGALTFGNAH